MPAAAIHSTVKRVGPAMLRFGWPCFCSAGVPPALLFFSVGYVAIGEPAGRRRYLTSATFRPEFVAGAVNENVFQRWFADRDSFDLARKSFHHVGDKAMTVLTLEADLTIEHLRIDFEARANFFGKGFGISSVEQDHVPANFLFQFRGSAESHQFAFIQDRQTIAMFSFFHEMSSHDHGNFFFIPQNLQVLPKVAARS